MVERIPWQSRIKIALIDFLNTLLKRLRGDGDWEYIPVWHEELPVAIVSMSDPEYQALVLLGYSPPEEQEIDWELVPPYDMDEAQIAAMHHDAIAAMREVVRQRIAARSS